MDTLGQVNSLFGVRNYGVIDDTKLLPQKTLD